MLRTLWEQDSPLCLDEAFGEKLAADLEACFAERERERERMREDGRRTRTGSGRERRIVPVTLRMPSETCPEA